MDKLNEIIYKLYDIDKIFLDIILYYLINENKLIK